MEGPVKDHASVFTELRLSWHSERCSEPFSGLMAFWERPSVRPYVPTDRKDIYSLPCLRHCGQTSLCNPLSKLLIWVPREIFHYSCLCMVTLSRVDSGILEEPSSSLILAATYLGSESYISHHHRQMQIADAKGQNDVRVCVCERVGGCVWALSWDTTLIRWG